MASAAAAKSVRRKGETRKLSDEVTEAKPAGLARAGAQRSAFHPQEDDCFGGKNRIDDGRTVDPQHDKPRHQRVICNQAQREGQDERRRDSPAKP